ncbi:unnamed protein product [Orchesella dallaii]|uniref:Uncharacterized protein n=1 Tax=Orchesella dallaii TaxID=48710 RepID=A0ABP1QYK1_9HEXA
MNSIATICFTLLLASSAYGGTRVIRQTGWNSPPSTGWSGASPIGINMTGASEAIGEGGAVAEHDSVIIVEGGGWDAPATLSVNTGSGVGMYQSASNYQQSIINNDGSSGAYQGTSSSNSAYAYDYLGADATGANIEVQSNGWSASQGSGVTGQADELIHDGAAPTGGWPAKSSK